MRWLPLGIGGVMGGGGREGAEPPHKSLQLHVIHYMHYTIKSFKITVKMA